MTGETDPGATSRGDPAYRRLAARLRGHILDGTLDHGSRLPSESDLSRDHGVSRSTVREALRTLSSEGLIETVRGVTGGSFVRHPAPEHLARYLETSLHLLTSADEISVADLLEMREVLEVPACELAAARRGEDDLTTMRQILEREHDGLAHRTSSYDEPRQFHHAVLAASRNPLLPMLARPMFTAIRFRFRRSDAPTGFWVRVMHDHRRIYEHLRDGDGDGASRAMRIHLRSLATTYEQIDQITSGGNHAAPLSIID